jgi:flagellar assembly protein FliH
MPSSNQRSYARFIPREEVDSVTQWKFGAVDGSDLLEPPPIAEPVAEIPVEIDEAAQQALLQQACEQAHSEGYAAGQAQAALEWQQRMDDYIANQGRDIAQRLEGVLMELDTHLAGLQQALGQQVLELACDIARQVVRQELSVNTLALQPVVTEALGLVVAQGRPATVRLNPADMDAIAGALSTEADAPGVRWVPDAAVPVGGCLVEAAGMVVDGTLGKRWDRAIAALGLQSPWEQETDDAD